MRIPTSLALIASLLGAGSTAFACVDEPPPPPHPSDGQFEHPMQQQLAAARRAIPTLSDFQGLSEHRRHALEKTLKTHVAWKQTRSAHRVVVVAKRDR